MTNANPSLRLLVAIAANPLVWEQATSKWAEADKLRDKAKATSKWEQATSKWAEVREWWAEANKLWSAAIPSVPAKEAYKYWKETRC